MTEYRLSENNSTLAIVQFLVRGRFSVHSKLMKNVKLNVGYSHMFVSENMSLVKSGRPNDNTNNWGWVQLIINANLFKTDRSKLSN